MTAASKSAGLAAHVRCVSRYLLSEIGANNHLKKTSFLCKKIAKSFVKLSRFAGVSAAGARRRNPEPCEGSYPSTRDPKIRSKDTPYIDVKNLKPFCGRERSGARRRNPEPCEGSYLSTRDPKIRSKDTPYIDVKNLKPFCGRERPQAKSRALRGILSISRSADTLEDIFSLVAYELAH
jgi:hypothetical protein